MYQYFFINIKKCLVFDPDKRIKPEDAILHLWIISGIPKEILLFHKNLNEQNRKKERDNTQSIDKVKPKSELKRPSKSNFIIYQTQTKKIISNTIYSTEKGESKKKKCENSFANKTK